MNHSSTDKADARSQPWESAIVTSSVAHGTTTELALLSRLWLRPADVDSSPHLPRAIIGGSLVTLCDGRWSIRDRMDAFLEQRDGTCAGFRPCLGCRNTRGTNQIEIGLRELLTATTFALDGEGG